MHMHIKPVKTFGNRLISALIWKLSCIHM